MVPHASARKPISQLRNYGWAELVARPFEIEVLVWPRCSGRMRLVATIMERDVIRAILGSMGLPADSPPLALAFVSPLWLRAWNHTGCDRITIYFKGNLIQ